MQVLAIAQQITSKQVKRPATIADGDSSSPSHVGLRSPSYAEQLMQTQLASATIARRRNSCAINSPRPSSNEPSSCAFSEEEKQSYNTNIASEEIFFPASGQPFVSVSEEQQSNQSEQACASDEFCHNTTLKRIDSEFFLTNWVGSVHANWTVPEQSCDLVSDLDGPEQFLSLPVPSVVFTAAEKTTAEK
mmetsp:Transcript_3237/g.6588  ORF Transcript_3237/g.6588 Transcript_3237/m.6588 type:complete len:190 (+) Transcript_3237:2-571(+)